MYKRYWLLNSRPFEAFAGKPFFCSLKTQQAVADKLRYSLMDQPGCCLLTGMPGTGKTALAAHLIAEHEDQFEQIVWLHQPYLDLLDLLRQTSSCLIPEQDQVERNLLTAGQLRDQILQFLVQTRQTVLFVLDEAHTLKDPQCLAFLKFLYEWGLMTRASHSAGEDVPRVSLLLMGHPAIHQHLEQALGFPELITMQQVLPNLSREELETYLTHRLQAAGRSERCFHPSAFDALHRLSGGQLRKLNQLADLSLLVGYVQQAQELTDQEVQQAGQELMLQRAG